MIPVQGAEYERREEDGSITRCMYFYDDPARVFRRQENGVLIPFAFPIKDCPPPKDGMHPASHALADFAKKMKVHHANA